MRTAGSLPVLWHFPISHFNEKVRWALDYKSIPHTRRALGLSYLPRALWATGYPTLPILFLDGKAIRDSTRIIGALEQARPDPRLYPSDAAERERALALEDFFDERLAAPVRASILEPLFRDDPEEAIKVLSIGIPSARAILRFRGLVQGFKVYYEWRHNINAVTGATARAEIRAALDRIESELQPSGYLVGESFSVADLTAAALLCPVVMPAEFEYRPPEPHPQVAVELRSSLAGHVGFRWVVEMYRRHRGRSAEVMASPRASGARVSS